MIQATLTPIIAPLVGQLDAQRKKTIERQADQLVSHAEQIGRLNAALEARTASHCVEPTTEPSVSFLRRRWVWVTVLIAIVVLTAWLLAWPR